MKQTTKQTIANALRDYLNSKGLTQSDFAKKINISAEYISHILKENSNFSISTGNGNTLIADKYFTKIADFIGFELTKTYWETKPTNQLVSLIANLQDAKDYGATNVITGDTGGGKTFGIHAFLRKNPADTFIVTVGSTDNLGDLIDKVIDQLKITTGKTKSKKLRDIAKKLRGLKENGLSPQLIFDEAEYMKQPALASMKELYDHLNKHCSIILIGTEQLIDNINTLRKKNKPGIPQFYRRIKFGIRKLPPVDRSYRLFLQDIDNDVKRFLRSICDNYGELHDVLVPVRREAERTGEVITEAFIRKVLNLPKEWNG